MRAKYLVIALLVALLPTVIYAPALIEAAMASPVMVNVEKIVPTTYRAHRSGTRTSFTLDAYYPCSAKTGRCACARFWLTRSNTVSGDGTDLLPTLRALEGKRVRAWVSTIFGDEHCWFESNFSEHRGYSLVFGLIAFAYLFLQLRAKK